MRFGMMRYGAPAGAIGTESDMEVTVPTGNPADWNNYPSPPMVQAVPYPTPSAKGVSDVIGDIVGGFVNIFGQRINPQTMQPVQRAPDRSWVVPVAVVGGIVVLGVVAMSRGGRRSMAGYRRRRRSR